MNFAQLAESEKVMNDETQETQSNEETQPPVFVETPESLALLAFVRNHNELALSEFAKHPSNVMPVLLKRHVPDGTYPMGFEIPVVTVDMAAKPPAPLTFAVGPQIGIAIPNLPGFFYTTAEAEKKYSNGHVFSDGTGARYKFITQETWTDGVMSNVTYWVRTTHQKKTEVK